MSIDAAALGVAERDAMLRLLRTGLGQDHAADDIAWETLDWPVFFNMAFHLKLAPQVFRLSERKPWGAGIPDAVRAKLHASYVRTYRRNVALLRALQPLLWALQDAEVPVVVLKGTHLLEAVYHDKGVRPMGDLDILVKPDYLSKTEQVMVSQGWRPYQPDLRQYELELCNHLVYQAGCHIDLHWRLDRPQETLRLDLESMWCRCVEAQVAGAPARMFEINDLMLHLLLHCSARSLFRNALRDLHDIAFLSVTQGQLLDWDQVVSRALATGTPQCAYLALTYAQDMFGASIPPQVTESLAPLQEQSTIPDFIERMLWGRNEDADVAAVHQFMLRDLNQHPSAHPSNAVRHVRVRVVDESGTQMPKATVGVDDVLECSQYVADEAGIAIWPVVERPTMTALQAQAPGVASVVHWFHIPQEDTPELSLTVLPTAQVFFQDKDGALSGRCVVLEPVEVVCCVDNGPLFMEEPLMALLAGRSATAGGGETRLIDVIPGIYRLFITATEEGNAEIVLKERLRIGFELRDGVIELSPGQDIVLKVDCPSLIVSDLVLAEDKSL